MPKDYHHLSYEERCQLYVLKKQGLTQKAIAVVLGRSISTICRELKRNKGKRGYRYEQASKMATSRRVNASSAANKKMTPGLIQLIEDKLTQEQWSPEQISGWLKEHHETSVSHETIYKHIWQNKKKGGGTLHQHLRHAGKKYNKRAGKNAGRGCIPERVGIEDRPAIVELKERIGDFEIDTIIGKNHQMAIVSMVDRKSKYTKLVKVARKTADEVSKALEHALMPLKDKLRTLTADNGKEFAAHQKVAAALGLDVYFARPYHSWERGLNEHTNGLVRQYFPKKTCFATISDEEVARVEFLLNTRPRKVLNFKTPLEVFFSASDQSQKIALGG